MKFTVARDVLSEAVSWTARALPVRPASPILAGVRIHADNEELTLSSFDYEVSANSRIPANVEEKAKFWFQVACWQTFPNRCRISQSPLNLMVRR